jgi:hypothetical protein
VNAIAPSVLDEGDPDDEPFPTRAGQVALVDGTTTAYVACARSDQGSTLALSQSIADSAATDLFAPRGNSDKPIPTEHIHLCAQLSSLLQGMGHSVRNGGLGGDAINVYATHSWVQVDLSDEGSVLLVLTQDGIALNYTTEVYVDAHPALMGEDDARDEAESIMHTEIAPKMEAIGFQRTDCSVFTQDSDHATGSNLAEWESKAKSAAAAATRIHQLSEFVTIMRVELVESASDTPEA